MNAQKITIILVLISYVFNAFEDAIAHGGGGRKVLELWHILKFLSHAIPIFIILYLLGVPLLVYPLTVVALCLWWEFFYQIARALEIWRWDNKLKIPLLRKIWRF